MSEAYVTLATTDGYGVGALVLGHSLLSHKTTRQLCILVTPGVSQSLRDALANVYNKVIQVDVMDSNDSAHLALLDRPELGVTFTKLHCWTLTQYSKCVFLDADVLAIQNTDELFQEPELSAACDIGWPDCFNSGMFVFTPSMETYERLLQFARTTGSFDGGDQGLLNSFFQKWNRLSFVYNMVASATYSYLPAFTQFGRNVKLVHFLGSTKPWHGESISSSDAGRSTYATFLQTWWAIYKGLVKPTLPECDSRGDGASSSSGTDNIIVGSSSPYQQPTEDHPPHSSPQINITYHEHKEEQTEVMQMPENTLVHDKHEPDYSNLQLNPKDIENASPKSELEVIVQISEIQEPVSEPEDKSLALESDHEDISHESEPEKNFESSPKVHIPPEVLFRDSYSATGQPLVITVPAKISVMYSNRINVNTEETSENIEKEFEDSDKEEQIEYSSDSNESAEDSDEFRESKLLLAKEVTKALNFLTSL